MNKSSNDTQHLHSNEALMRYAKLLGFGEIHTKIDQKTGLHAIIAINNTQLGPAIGGCRLNQYHTFGAAMSDALRLAYMMTLKAAVTDLPHGGAKSVILKPKVIKDRKAFFRSFGDFVHKLNGDYITAVDVGSNTEDMDTIAERTPYVIGAPKTHQVEEDPSPYTSQGVMQGIEAAVKFRLDRDNVEGLHIAIQGAGRVAFHLAKLLHEGGAKITICDPKKESVQQFVDKFGANAVDIEKIYDVPCDVFSPCALGGILNLSNINRLQTNIIAGCANNQLAHRRYSRVIHDRGILYAPDFVINAGGLIYAAMVYDFRDPQLADIKIKKIYDILLNIFSRSEHEGLHTTKIAELLAKEKLAAAGDRRDGGNNTNEKNQNAHDCELHSS